MTNILKEKLLKVVFPVIEVAAIIVAGYFYWQIHTLKQDPQAAAQAEVNSLVAQVSKLIVLPTNEVPTVATVSDPSALAGQSFFTSAQKGDKVLIYSQAKEAILYSVSMNKIINVAPLNTGDTTATTTPSATSTTATASKITTSAPAPKK